MADPIFGVGFKPLPQIDPAATNALDNTPDVNMPDVTGSVSGSFDFLTAFFTKFSEILMPPVVSQDEKDDLQRISEDPTKSPAEQNAAKAQLEAATMVNAFSSPLVRLAILTYIVIIILNILKRIPGVSGVPSMSAVLRGLFETGEFKYSDEIDISSGFFTIRKAINYDETYIGTSPIKYENLAGAEVMEENKDSGHYYPQWGYDGVQPKIPFFPDAMPTNPQWSTGRWFRNIQSTCSYYMKFSGGQLNVGSSEDPDVFTLTSIPELFKCDPLLLRGDGTVAQKASGRQLQVDVVENKIKIGSSSTTTRFLLSSGIPKNPGSIYTEPIGNLEFVKEAQMVGQNIEPTDRMSVSNLVFKGDLSYGWNIEEQTKVTYSESDPYETYKNKISMAVTWDQDDKTPNLDSDNILMFTLDEPGGPQLHNGHKILKMMFGELKRMDGSGILNEEEVSYSPKYVEIWGFNPQDRGVNSAPPMLFVIRITDVEKIGRLILSSSKKEFVKTGLNKNEIYDLFFDDDLSDPNSVPSLLHSAYISFWAATGATESTNFWNLASNGLDRMYYALNAVQKYIGYTEQFRIIGLTVQELYLECFDWISTSGGSSITDEDRERARKYSSYMIKLEKMSNGAGKYCKNKYEPQTASGDGDSNNVCVEGGYYISKANVSNTETKWWRWRGTSGTSEAWDDFMQKVKRIADPIEGYDHFFDSGLLPAMEVGLGLTEMSTTVLDVGASFVDDSEATHVFGIRRKVYGQAQFNSGPSKNQIQNAIHDVIQEAESHSQEPNLKNVLLPDLKDFVISFVNGKATVENNIGIDAIGNNYPPNVVIADSPEIEFEVLDPCTIPQAALEKKLRMLVDNDADEFTVMASFGCCYTPDLWDKFLELKKMKRHMVRW